jgi:large conductance mechanosensitive channel
MPRLPDQEDNVVTRARDRFKEAWDGFWDFALRDNVLEVAIGLMYIQQPSQLSTTRQMS